MKSMKGLLAATVALAALTVSANASAAVLTYNVSGTFTNGALLSGSFSFDPAGSIFSQFSNVNLAVSGLGTFNTIGGLSYSGTANGTGPFGIGASTTMLPNTSVSLGFTGTHTGAVLNAITTNVLTSNSSYIYNNGVITYLTGGTITAAAVPETATWGMMLAGFGLMGAAMRYRRRSAKVAYA